MDQLGASECIIRASPLQAITNEGHNSKHRRIAGAMARNGEEVGPPYDVFSGRLEAKNAS